jgi:hypothetical protein
MAIFMMASDAERVGRATDLLRNRYPSGSAGGRKIGEKKSVGGFHHGFTCSLVERLFAIPNGIEKLLNGVTSQ